MSKTLCGMRLGMVTRFMTLAVLGGAFNGLTSAQEKGQERAVSIEREIERIAGMKPLWPGFDPLKIPLAIYSGEATYLFRHPAPPEGFVPVGDAKLHVHSFPGRFAEMVKSRLTW